MEVASAVEVPTRRRCSDSVCNLHQIACERSQREQCHEYTHRRETRMQRHCSYYGTQDKNNMRLHHLEHQQHLSEYMQTQSITPLSNSATKQNIADWYSAAFQTASPPYWLANGFITDWRASFADWLSSMTLPKLQLLDDTWRGYATQLHYIHYLKSLQSHLDSQAAELDAQRSKLKLQLADAEKKADDFFTKKSTRRRTKR